MNRNIVIYLFISVRQLCKADSAGDKACVTGKKKNLLSPSVIRITFKQTNTYRQIVFKVLMLL